MNVRREEFRSAMFIDMDFNWMFCNRAVKNRRALKLNNETPL